jgi:hypothetical protein
MCWELLLLLQALTPHVAKDVEDVGKVAEVDVIPEVVDVLEDVDVMDRNVASQKVLEGAEVVDEELPQHAGTVASLDTQLLTAGTLVETASQPSTRHLTALVPPASPELLEQIWHLENR